MDGGAPLPHYEAFLQQKVRLDRSSGFEVDPGEMNPCLADFTRAMVGWMLKGGRRALFAKFGLRKTVTQIEVMRLLLKKRPGKPKLIVAPLNVRHEFRLDAEAYFQGEHAVDLRFVQATKQIDDDRPLWITNYESVREGKLDPTGFDVSLDEASILRGFGGTKTFREFMRLFEHTPTYRFVATATPSPNEFIELLAYAAFLDVMDVGQAKTRFFRRDSEHADQLTIHPHKEREFWLWVASWALFVQQPSDLGFSDAGFDLPELDVRWHEIPSDHSEAGAEKDGQARLFRSAAIGVVDAAREKRSSLGARVEKLTELRAEQPEAHRLIWHDLEAERLAIEKAIPGVGTVYGSQAAEEQERLGLAFRNGTLKELAAKPVMLGSGSNFQRFCWWAVFLGIGFKFNDFIQAVHRIQRFGQGFHGFPEGRERKVRIDILYTEAERHVREELLRRWKQHDAQMAIMTGIIRAYGLAGASMAAELQRAMTVTRREAAGEGWRLVNNDTVDETAAMASDSVELVVTSIPFSTQYEYSPSYRDFGHTDDDRHFWQQMDYLIPELWRVLKPGRVAAIHVKDRIVPSGLTGLGFQTVSPFSDDTVARFRKHGFGFLARKTVVTDVVRENNQTYRLGWTEQCKDGSRMGAGMPEYVLLFRKPPSDRSNGYADVPVVKDKKFWDGDHWDNPDGYSVGRWQIDAHGYMRSGGNRLLQPEDLVGLDAKSVFRLYRRHSFSQVYDFDHHVACAEALQEKGSLPPTFMLLPPQSWHPDVWTDITRMRTLNGEQSQKNRQMHLCPLQFDIVDRLVAQFSMPGETVYDPFAGLGTVPLRALRLKRRGIGTELSPSYFDDSVWYLKRQEAEAAIPALFDLDARDGEDDDSEAA
ncbi:DNA methyltransferase [Reyranella sp.]|uniref:DNA methyltransferase n=1 Tax=Reyranella sp. TaxID=1929291 RepID=UPI003D0C4810